VTKPAPCQRALQKLHALRLRGKILESHACSLAGTWARFKPGRRNNSVRQPPISCHRFVWQVRPEDVARENSAAGRRIFQFYFSCRLRYSSGIKSGTTIKFWGVRGSIPTPGRGTVRYGGNTTCIEVRIGDDIIILDAGTGLRLLGQSLLKEFKRQPLNLTLLISHTHWDHIQGLPFFAPIYDSRCRMRILGGEGARKGLVAALTGQMESSYFPVPFSKLPSNIEIEELR